MFIRTSRLFLRPAWKDDVPALDRALGDTGLRHALRGTPALEAMADTESLLATASNGRDTRLLIFRRTPDEPRLVGAVGMIAWRDQPEFALWLTPEARRHGYAVEAGHAALRLAFDGLRLPGLIAAAVAPGHPAGRLLGRLGFRLPTRDALFACLPRDESDDHVVMAA